MIKLGHMMGTMAAICLAAPAVAAPDLDTFRKELDSFVETQMRTDQVPGVAVAVLQNGEIVVAKGYGEANVEHDVPVTADTIFQSGSVGKMFTAVAVMRQVEQGKMGLDDPISKYLPDAPASWQAITVRKLLTHTSGVPNFEREFDLRKDYTDDELVKHAYSLPLDFAPGARWSYSNTGYILLGILIKKATGRSYLDVLDTDVFKPLGMKTAKGIDDAGIVPHRAAGYDVVDGKLKNQDWVSPTMNSTADGSLYFSLNDMIAWSRGVEQGKILTAADWQQVYTPVKLNSGKTYPYGFGWSLNQAAGKPRYHHGGAWQGFRTYFSRYLGDGMSLIVLANSGSANPGVMADGIAKLWDPALVALGPKPKPEPAVAARVTNLIETARAGKLKQQDVPLAGQGFADIANPYFAAMLKDLGPLTKLELTERKELGDDIVYSYVASFGAKTLKVQYAVAPGNQVSSFMLHK